MINLIIYFFFLPNIVSFFRYFFSFISFPTHIIHFKMRATPSSDRRQGRQLTNSSMLPCLTHDIKGVGQGEHEMPLGDKLKLTFEVSRPLVSLRPILCEDFFEFIIDLLRKFEFEHFLYVNLGDILGFFGIGLNSAS